MKAVFFSRDPVQSEAELQRFLHPEIAILPLDDQTCRVFARERGRLRRQGHFIGDMDLFIAATCLQQGLILLTNNRRHFEAVQGLDLLSVR